jgi:hypothetical protein
MSAHDYFKQAQQALARNDTERAHALLVLSYRALAACAH